MCLKHCGVPEDESLPKQWRAQPGQVQVGTVQGFVRDDGEIAEKPIPQGTVDISFGTLIELLTVFGGRPSILAMTISDNMISLPLSEHDSMVLQAQFNGLPKVVMAYVRPLWGYVS